MFGSGKAKELQTQLTALRSKLENANKEKSDIAQQLKSALERITGLESKLTETEDAAAKAKADFTEQLEQKLAEGREAAERIRADFTQKLEEAQGKIASLEKQLEESEGAALKKKAQDTIVEYEGLKELYTQKTKEIEANRETVEEGFAREAAVKRRDLEDEIRTNREDNQNMVAETVKTFAGSYSYYLNQIRALMDAMSQAAKETGESLFTGEGGDIKERFGERILEHLHNDSDALKEGTGDILLIGQKEPEHKAEEIDEGAEEASEEACEAAEEAVEETCEAPEEVQEETCEAAEESCETFQEAAEEAQEETAAAENEAAEEACEATEETTAAVEEAFKLAEEAAEETDGTVEEAVKESAEEDEDEAGFVDDFIDDPEDSEA